MNLYKLTTDFTPQGDQPKAIDALYESIKSGNKYSTLLGVTGSGKTFTIANVISKLKLPVLVISHNKTLAAQLYAELKSFFANNAVEYFVSYYDYYQPEAYIPQTDTYIEKDAAINDRLDRLRLSATSSIISRKDVIVVASVSCIYNLGSPADYSKSLIEIEEGQKIERDNLIRELIKIQYERNDIDFKRGTLRVKGDVIDIFPSYKDDDAIRVEFFGDAIESISLIDPLNNSVKKQLKNISVYPAKHFVIEAPTIQKAVKPIKEEMEVRYAQLIKEKRIVEAQRLKNRTNYDIEMMLETGYCHGIENYSRHLSGRPAGSRPYCLLDYFKGKFLTIIDESHVSLPQIRGMYMGDKARKEVLVEHGFRLPSCLDNRPLRYNEFEKLLHQVIFVSATPAEQERNLSKKIVEQIVRPTGLVDPQIEVKQSRNQIDDIIKEVKEKSDKGERVLITTLTKRMAEDLSSHLKELGLKVEYLHSEIKTIERVKVLKDLRLRKFDCLVGVNLLREGIDLPEVSLVCILDADKEGFLRSRASLIQIAGRCARHVNAKVIMYADKTTTAMKKMIEETQRRRKIQIEYNKAHNIKPTSIKKAISEGLEIHAKSIESASSIISESFESQLLYQVASDIESEMYRAAERLEFEKAAALRDELEKVKIDILKQEEHNREK
jgi:excinuclease ABC subunit B